MSENREQGGEHIHAPEQKNFTGKQCYKLTGRKSMNHGGTPEKKPSDSEGARQTEASACASIRQARSGPTDLDKDRGESCFCDRRIIPNSRSTGGVSTFEE